MTRVEPSIRAGAERLRAAKRPAILVGPEGACAVEAILELASLLGAVILTTPDALSVIDGERSCGVFSFGASVRAKHAIASADLVLAVSALGEFTCRLGEAFAEHVVIQVAEHVTDCGRNGEPVVALVGPIRETLEKLRTALIHMPSAARRPWFDESSLPAPPAIRSARAGIIDPEVAIHAIQAALPERVRVCLDITSGALHAYAHWRLGPAQRVFSSIEISACMGEALLASLGVRLASDLPTLALVGDWCQCMVPAEIHTAVELELDRYVVVVWANRGGAFIGAGVRQQDISVPERAWRWRSPPDFARVAEAYGAHGVIVTDAPALEREVFAGLRGNRPVLIEARIDPDAPIPAGERFLSLGEARAANDNGEEQRGPSRVAFRTPAGEP